MTDDLKKKLDKMLEDATKYLDNYYKVNGKAPTADEYGKFLSHNWIKIHSLTPIEEEVIIFTSDYQYEHGGEFPPRKDFVEHMDPFVKQYAHKDVLKEWENDPEVKILRSKQS